MFWIKKKTKEEQMEARVASVLAELTSGIDFEFTELETAQILNDVRRKYAESLNLKKSDCLSKSTELHQKAKELENVLQFIE